MSAPAEAALLMLSRTLAGELSVTCAATSSLSPGPALGLLDHPCLVGLRHHGPLSGCPADEESLHPKADMVVDHPPQRFHVQTPVVAEWGRGPPTTLRRSSRSLSLLCSSRTSRGQLRFAHVMLYMYYMSYIKGCQGAERRLCRTKARRRMARQAPRGYIQNDQWPMTSDQSNGAPVWRVWT